MWLRLTNIWDSISRFYSPIAVQSVSTFVVIVCRWRDVRVCIYLTFYWNLRIHVLKLFHIHDHVIAYGQSTLPICTAIFSRTNKKTHKNHSMDGNTVMLFIKHHLVAYHVYIEYIVSTYHKMPFLICIIFQMCMHASMLIFKKYELRNFTGS